MPSGSKPGERRGGRKKGTPNRASIYRQQKAAESGPMPTDVMLDAMRHHYTLVLEERQKSRPDRKLVAAELALAHGYARDAAPYYHPKLATLHSNVNLTGRLTLEQLIIASMPQMLGANEDGPDGPIIEGEIVENKDGNRVE